MAKERDEYDPMSLKAEMAAIQAERAQERAEVALLRAQIQRYEETAKETDIQKQAFTKFLEWVALSAEQKTQLEADKRFAGIEADKWEVQLQEHPKVILPAHSEYEAEGRYKEICGITQTAHAIVCTRLTTQAA